MSHLYEAEDESGHVEDEEDHDERHQGAREPELLRSRASRPEVLVGQCYPVVNLQNMKTLSTKNKICVVNDKDFCNINFSNTFVQVVWYFNFTFALRVI